MQDADAIVAYSREQIAAHGLEVEEVRDAVVKYLLAIKFCPSTRLFIRNHDCLRYRSRTTLFAPRRSLCHSYIQCPDLGGYIGRHGLRRSWNGFGNRWYNLHDPGRALSVGN